jgi:hypothetical protein
MLLTQGRRCGRFKRKGEKSYAAETTEGYEIIPCEPLFQECSRERDEDDERDNLLNDLELEARELAVAEAIRRQMATPRSTSPRATA